MNAPKTRKFNFDEPHKPEPGSRVVRLAALRTRRAAKARDDLKRWTSKARRAAKMVRKLKARVKYYADFVPASKLTPATLRPGDYRDGSPAPNNVCELH